MPIGGACSKGNLPTGRQSLETGIWSKYLIPHSRVYVAGDNPVCNASKFFLIKSEKELMARCTPENFSRADALRANQGHPWHCRASPRSIFSRSLKELSASIDMVGRAHSGGPRGLISNFSLNYHAIHSRVSSSLGVLDYSSTTTSSRELTRHCLQPHLLEHF